MSLNIENRETHRLAKELADRTGESLTAAVTQALLERLARLRLEEDRAGMADRIHAIAVDMRARLPDDFFDVDHGEFLYDEDGLPEVIVDTSAVVAIVNLESDGPRFESALQTAPINRMSAGTYLEASIVIDRARDPLVSRRLDEIIAEAAIIIEPVTESQARIARDAYRDFGKGSGHPAGLNFGDCFAYALARELEEPLLFKGDDFRHTDIPHVGRPAERRRLSEFMAVYDAAAP